MRRVDERDRALHDQAGEKSLDERAGVGLAGKSIGRIRQIEKRIGLIERGSNITVDRAAVDGAIERQLQRAVYQ